MYDEHYSISICTVIQDNYLLVSVVLKDIVLRGRYDIKFRPNILKVVEENDR